MPEPGMGSSNDRSGNSSPGGANSPGAGPGGGVSSGSGEHNGFFGGLMDAVNGLFGGSTSPQWQGEGDTDLLSWAAQSEPSLAESIFGRIVGAFMPGVGVEAVPNYRTGAPDFRTTLNGLGLVSSFGGLLGFNPFGDLRSPGFADLEIGRSPIGDPTHDPHTGYSLGSGANPQLGGTQPGGSLMSEPLGLGMLGLGGAGGGMGAGGGLMGAEDRGRPGAAPAGPAGGGLSTADVLLWSEYLRQERDARMRGLADGFATIAARGGA